jgi:hypothetical protein
VRLRSAGSRQCQIDRGPHDTASRPAVVPWAARHRLFRANQPLHPVLMGRAEIGMLASFYFSKFPDLFQIIAELKNLHIIQLTAENSKTNFVG